MAKEAIKRIYREEKIYMNKEPLVLHSDNGSQMKGVTMLETLYALGITPSSRSTQIHAGLDRGILLKQIEIYE